MYKEKDFRDKNNNHIQITSQKRKKKLNFDDKYNIQFSKNI